MKKGLVILMGVLSVACGSRTEVVNPEISEILSEKMTAPAPTISASATPLLTASPIPTESATATPTAVPTPIVANPFDDLEEVAFGDVIPSADLLADFEIFKEAYLTLHPSLDRYQSMSEIERHFDYLEAELQEDLTLAQAYLAFSVMLAQVQDGHTYANFFNQGPMIKRELFNRKDKLPFLFRIVDGRMLITHSAAEDERLELGVEIISIDGVPVEEILTRLTLIVKADGSNDGKRMHDLQVTGTVAHEWFDVLYPLMYPVENEQFALELVDLNSGESFEASVEATTPGRRKAAISKKYEDLALDPIDSWQFEILEGEIGYLLMGTFTMWQINLDWEQFLADAFQELQEKEIEHLIVDIRGNEGGLTAVNEALVTYLVPAGEIQDWEYTFKYQYDVVPEYLQEVTNSFEQGMYDISERVVALPEGGFTDVDAPPAGQIIRWEPRQLAFDGEVYLLVDAGNSSATFSLATILQENEVVTTVGQVTGGNQMGTSGGNFFQLELPNSGIVTDIPLIGSFPVEDQPDAGLTPNVLVEKSVDDLINGVDSEIEAVRALIGGG